MLLRLAPSMAAIFVKFGLNGTLCEMIFSNFPIFFPVDTFILA